MATAKDDRKTDAPPDAPSDHPVAEGLSQQAHFSKYTQVPPDDQAVPPDGHTVEQELGKPTEDPPSAFQYGS